MNSIINKVLNSMENNDNKLKTLFETEFIKNKNSFCNFLYVHTPFCPKRCSYCLYTGITEYTKKNLSDFIEHNLKYQIEVFQNIFNNVNFDMIYFGGGTPNVYSTEQLEYIYHNIPNFKNIKYKTSEVHPAILTNEQIELYKKYEFNLSLGVQTLDKTVLKKVNRINISKYHLKEITQNLGDMFYNIDIIAYLDKGTTDDNIITKRDLEFISEEIQSPSITLHYNGNVGYTKEKSFAFINMVKEFCEKYNYICVNALLNEIDVKLMQTKELKHILFEPKLIKKDRVKDYVPNYMHNSFVLNGSFTFGYNILSIGDKKGRLPLYSHTGNYRYFPGSCHLIYRNDINLIEWANFLYTLKCYQKSNVKTFLKD